MQPNLLHMKQTSKDNYVLPTVFKPLTNILTHATCGSNFLHHFLRELCASGNS